MTIVSGLLGIRPKRAPPGMHRSIGRFSSYDGIEPLRVSQVLRTVFSYSGILGGPVYANRTSGSRRSLLLGKWQFPKAGYR
jgi:hypothetical protein